MFTKSDTRQDKTKGRVEKGEHSKFPPSMIGAAYKKREKKGPGTRASIQQPALGSKETQNIEGEKAQVDQGKCDRTGGRKT